jgi:hypothetical protein
MGPFEVPKNFEYKPLYPWSLPLQDEVRSFFHSPKSLPPSNDKPTLLTSTLENVCKENSKIIK